MCDAKPNVRFVPIADNLVRTGIVPAVSRSGLDGQPELRLAKRLYEVWSRPAGSCDRISITARHKNRRRVYASISEEIKRASPVCRVNQQAITWANRFGWQFRNRCKLSRFVAGSQQQPSHRPAKRYVLSDYKNCPSHGPHANAAQSSTRNLSQLRGCYTSVGQITIRPCARAARFA
jgi:hypothetical protein